MITVDTPLSYIQLVATVRKYLGWGENRPSHSSISRWTQSVLRVPKFDPVESREYSYEDAMALVFWARAGQLVKRGCPRGKRIAERQRLFKEALETWQSNLLKK